jgi:hypothetical protein
MTQSDKFMATCRAHAIGESFNVSAYLERHDMDAAQYHARCAHDEFAKLADLMGYTVTKKGGA